ncbi:MAG: DUF1349 domain-containing protein [Fimbriimonas sp.]
MEWLNEPPRWSDADGVLTLETGKETDFWRETHYGFIHNDGHHYFRSVDGDFTATVRFSGQYEALYDQAGLMIRLDDRNWIKAGIEFTDGLAHLSVVVTRDFSDWSVTALETVPAEVWLRMSRHGDAVRVEYRLANTEWRMLRLAYLAPGPTAFVGPMACSPTRTGFIAEFRDLVIGAPISKELH